VGYEWQAWALDALDGLEPHEVLQALGAGRRWPRWATGTHGMRVLTVWARTRTGRPLIVAVRQVDAWDWQILGAREMSGADLTEFEKWEAHRDV
jgi:hypothetical protein